MVITDVQKLNRYTTFICYNWEFFFTSLQNSFSHESRNTPSSVATRVSEIKEDLIHFKEFAFYWLKRYY